MANERMKGLRKKTSDASYGSLIPFGTDGIYTDLFSSLNLQEQLKLGGGHLATIIEKDGVTTIVQKYEKNTATKSNPIYDSISYFEVDSSIEQSDESTTITQNLYSVDSSDSKTLIHSKKVIISTGDDGQLIVTQTLDPS